MDYNRCKRSNKCKDFELNPTDSLCENPTGYKPRPRMNKNDGQISFLQEKQ